MKVAVVTPTIGSKHLKQCLESVQKQTYHDITHYVFVDGVDFQSAVEQAISSLPGFDKSVKTIVLEENVGKDWYGHRVYAACSFLVNADIICYLDEDNWLQPDHVEHLVKEIVAGADWAYSLRRIHNKEGEYICDDNCESLGKWPVFFDEQVYHIDTSCYGVRRDAAVRVGHSWYGQWGADRKFFHTLKTYFPNYSCTGKHSLSYRLDGNPNSVNKEFFGMGNAKNLERYQGAYPWTMKQTKEIELGPGIKLVP